MIVATQASQAMLARSAVRSAVGSSRVASASSLRRTIVTSSARMQATETTVPDSTASANTNVPATEAVASPPTFTSTSASSAASTATATAKALAMAPTSGRQRRGKPVTESDKAKLLLKWDWLDPDVQQRRSLAGAVQRRESKYPDWVKSEFELAKSYRSARARLWIPTAEEISAQTGAEVTDAEAWIEQQIDAHRAALEAKHPHAEAAQKRHEAKDGEINEFSLPTHAELWDLIEPEQQIDVVLRTFWRTMSQDARDKAMLRVRYDCIRKLGWRQGYSSGYPRPSGQGKAGAGLPEHFGAEGEQGLEALRKLQQREGELAWEAWQAMTPEKRVAEEKAAWQLRDRSQLYLDDSDDSIVLGAPAPRWYDVPERAGQLTFLPNTIVRLVKNHTPEGQAYDPWKATFRVPLSMHKHGLRTYLLQIYGLKTTWARSSIYRSPVTRDSRTGMKITGKGRTHKKIEVGLLEPFLFPEISPDFQKRHLLSSELDYERSRVYLKMTKTARWRGKKSADQYEGEIANRERSTFHHLDALSSDGIRSDDKQENEKFPRFLVRAKGIPSAKHGKILQLLAEQRSVKEQRVNALVQQFKAEALDQPASGDKQ
ncbi:hypothetical protein BCV70DRAFT_196517 [Testicularia cyperi]|uniref:Large ribosomal subunit protein uL23m n=1 Tax=Testicularia cyperi TaxID=1882483 RepID=A0A317XG77_9BASI|nr:hypothetical protein BCV70DRAFT_196517 [Testicularia cyperi]